MAKKMALVTFGCQMNVHDSQRIEDLMRASGYELVDSPNEADVVVLNTCSVREKAEQKLRSEAGRLKKHDVVLVIAGCVAQQEGEAIVRDMPYVDVVIGPDNLAELPALVREAELGAPPAVRTVFDLDAPRFLTHTAASGPIGASAFVTVMKGCDERCSFCIVPYTRGAERYRPADEVLAEVRSLVENGAREVMLLGQTVNSYLDPTVPRGAEDDPDESQFPSLLGRIARETPALDRLRYTSPHPRHLTASLVEAHRALDVLSTHVHMPVQSGSDRMLKRMIRRYTRKEYVARVQSLVGARPGMTLSTDIIVGFPGETRADFDETLSLVAEVGFVSLFGFKYSPRPFTPALKLGDDVPEGEKQQRLMQLFALSEAQTRQHLGTLVGTRQEVLIEGSSRAGGDTLVGRTRGNAIVHMARCEGTTVGAVVTVEVLRANKHSVEGAIESVRRPGLERATEKARRVALPVVAA